MMCQVHYRGQNEQIMAPDPSRKIHSRGNAGPYVRQLKYVVAKFASLYFCGVSGCLALILEGWIDNVLEGANRSLLARNILHAVGYMTFEGCQNGLRIIVDANTRGLFDVAHLTERGGLNHSPVSGSI